jgi:peptidoglycan hydrolase CwlO-like protein
MGSKRLTVPYVLDDGSRGQSFTRELELASLYVVGDSRRGLGALEAAAFVTYPLLLKQYDGGSVMIDSLGLHKTSLRYDHIPEVETFIKVVDNASVEPGNYLKTLKRLSSHFKDFTGKETLTFKGLVAQPPNIGDIKSLLERTIEPKTGTNPTIFNPVLKDANIKEVIDSIMKMNKSLEEDQKTLEKPKKVLQESLDTARKVLMEETLNVKDSSAKVQARLKGSLEKKKGRLKKKLNRNVVRITSAYKKQTGPLREERTKRKRKLTRAEKRVGRLKSQSDPQKLEAEKKTQRKLKKKYEELDRAVKSLDGKRDAEIMTLRTQFEAELGVDAEKLEEERAQTRNRLEEIQSLEAEIRAEVKAIMGQIDALIRKKRAKRKSLDKFKVEFDEGPLEISIPFYVFHFGKKRFDFYPPVEVVGNPGLLSRFRRMLTDNLEGKMNMLIRPQDGFSDRFLERAVKSLGRDNPLGRAYSQEAERLNLFRSRKAVDQMMLGLLRLRRGGWISDSYYIRLQEALVDQIGAISQP